MTAGRVEPEAAGRIESGQPAAAPDILRSTARPDGQRPVVLVGAPTERRNPQSTDLDLMSTRDVLAVINEADRRVPAAVTAVLDEIASAVDLAVRALLEDKLYFYHVGVSFWNLSAGGVEAPSD